MFSLPLPSEEESTITSSLNPFNQTDLNIDQKKDQKSKIKSDSSLSFSIKLLGFQNILFLLNTLMMEEVIF